MTERGFGALSDVVFDTHPEILLIADFLAIHAGGEDSFEPFDSNLQTDDALSDHDAGRKHLGIVGLGYEIVCAGAYRL